MKIEKILQADVSSSKLTPNAYTLKQKIITMLALAVIGLLTCKIISFAGPVNRSDQTDETLGHLCSIAVRNLCNEDGSKCLLEREAIKATAHKISRGFSCSIKVRESFYKEISSKWKEPIIACTPFVKEEQEDLLVLDEPVKFNFKDWLDEPSICFKTMLERPHDPSVNVGSFYNNKLRIKA